eukprot:6253309-Pyramimonas_sp.AAC.1
MSAFVIVVTAVFACAEAAEAAVASGPGAARAVAAAASRASAAGASAPLGRVHSALLWRDEPQLKQRPSAGLSFGWCHVHCLPLLQPPGAPKKVQTFTSC